MWLFLFDLMASPVKHHVTKIGEMFVCVILWAKQ